MMTETEIIKETRDYYAEDPADRRGISRGTQCEFVTDNGKRCAVGRCMTDEAIDVINCGGGIGGDSLPALDALLKKNGIEMFKPEYRGKDFEFWFHLQEFHDPTANWNYEGITAQGEGEYRKLLEVYGN